MSVVTRGLKVLRLSGDQLSFKASINEFLEVFCLIFHAAITQ
ncbi:hypothetical protein [Polynucleobacter sp. Adler-ghost]|nr:hypothetical protein [Polynucleobacter sp. Adler-ghost]